VRQGRGQPERPAGNLGAGAVGFEFARPADGICTSTAAIGARIDTSSTPIRCPSGLRLPPPKKKAKFASIEIRRRRWSR
jgi:hypothetical protein